MTTKEAHQEKNSAATTSVVAAVGLTTFKIIVGISTGSLGILAEAAHSGLDLVAALVTLVAVRLSGKPADSEHPYGHGKIENLSAMFETLLLLLTCVWIIYEAVQRLFFVRVKVEVSIWSFIVMAVSIIIDYNRSRILYKAAKKHNSQALEADALHFSTDIWSSSVVILGLICVVLAEYMPSLTFLEKADSVAALGVALIVVYISIQLGIRTVQGLLDTAPEGMEQEIIKVVGSLPGVEDCHRVRIRHSGPHLFIDTHVLVNGSLELRDAHALTEVIEAKIREISPEADVIVHPEPVEESIENPKIIKKITLEVQTLAGVVDCHNVHLHYADSRTFVTAHVLVRGDQSLESAHLLTENIERKILEIIPGAEVSIHPEPINF
jgi:cation diffusion facilitator family transporter